MAIGSRTKGVTETKRFNGNVKANRVEIPDTSYIRHRYYNIAFTGRPIRPGTIKVWRDDRNIFNNVPGVTQSGMTSVDYTVTSSTFTGDFDPLIEGQDFSLDLTRGLLILTRDAAIDAILAVDYTFDDTGTLLSATNVNTGFPGAPKLIKTPNDLPLVGDPALSFETGWQRELKTFYSIGQTKIVADNGQGNFLLKTEDLNRLDNAVFLNDFPTHSQLVYPGRVYVDFTNGIFNISPVPVAVDTTTLKLYDPSPAHGFSFVVQYSYKVVSYIIKPGIIFGSEKVTLNGRTLTRDADYFIDYASGYLTFFNADQIDESTQIEVTYEYAPFGLDVGDTLVGTREELDLVPGRFKAGSTFLYDFAAKPTIVPSVQNLPQSLMILEADGQLKDWTVPFTPAKLSLTAEVAKSKDNPNVFGRAIIDSMEGVKQEIQAVMGPELWAPSANPANPFPNVGPGGTGGSRPDALWTSLSDEQLHTRDVNPAVDDKNNDKIRVMDLPYSMQHRPGGSDGDPQYISIVQNISKAGQDFSQKLYMEMWVQGAGSAGQGVDMRVDIGQLNEAADGDTSGMLKTEDSNHDGTLNFGEDVGWLFNDAGSDGLHSGPVVIGAGNNRLDTEDLDGDGAFRTVDMLPRGEPIMTLSGIYNNMFAGARILNPSTGADESNTIRDLSFTGWRIITVPLNVSVSEAPDFQAIKDVRLTLINGAAGTPAREGTIKLAKLSFIGTTWEKPTIVSGATASTMTLSAVNNVDTPGYVSLIGNPAFNDLYGDQASNQTREQALSLQYDLQAGDTATTRQVYQTARDFSTHRNLRFFLRVPAGMNTGGTLSLQLGSETDYYEYTVPLTSRYVGTWVLENLALVDVSGDGIPDIMKPENPLGVFKIVGSPSFQRIGQIKLVIRNDMLSALNSEVWVDEIHLVGARKRDGFAQRYSADLLMPEWGSLSGRVRKVDRNFQTLTAQVLNQDRNESSANVSLTRLRWLPLSGNLSKSQTVTPAVFRTGDAGLVSLLSEGRETSVTGRGDGQLLIPKLPAFGFSYDKALSKSTTLGQLRNRDTYTGSADYQVLWAPDIIPGKLLTFRPLPQSIYVKYVRTNSSFSTFNSTFSFAQQMQDAQNPAIFPDTTTTVATVRQLAFNNAATLQMSDEWTFRAPLSPWNGLSLQPGATWKTTRQRTKFSDDVLSLAPDFSGASSFGMGYSQGYTLAGSWRVLRWLEPRFDGDITGSETNVLPMASSTTAFNNKLVTRNAHSNFFWTFRAADLLPNFDPTKSLRLDTSWRLESGDAYQNIDRGDTSWRKVDPFVFKKVARQGGGKMFSLLGPLDLANPTAQLQQETDRNSFRTSLDASPFDWIAFRGPAGPLRTFHVTATVTKTDEHTNSGSAIRDAATTVWPDLLFSIRDTEKFLFVERWMKNSQVNVRANRKDTETFGQDFSRANSMGSDYHFLFREKYDVFLSYGVTNGFSRNLQMNTLTSTSKGYSDSAQVGTRLGGWQVTPRIDLRSDVSADSTGLKTQDSQGQTYSVMFRLDKTYPRGFRIPFTRRIYENVNRLIVDGKLTYDRKSSSINVGQTNTDTYTADLTGEWEISRYFRLSFGGGASEIVNRVQKDAGVMSFNVNSQLIINF
jgi:hypothetical protein